MLGRLSGGFDLRGASLAAVSDREILGRAKHAAAAPARRKAPATAISSICCSRIGRSSLHDVAIRAAAAKAK